MKIIENKLLPPKGYCAMMFCGVLLCRDKRDVDDETINHESIHTRQMFELLVIGFYAWYLVEYLVRLLMYRNHDKAYRNISVEREAYANERNAEYLQHRKFWKWLKYLFNEK